MSTGVKSKKVFIPTGIYDKVNSTLEDPRVWDTRGVKNVRAPQGYMTYPREYTRGARVTRPILIETHDTFCIMLSTCIQLEDSKSIMI